MEGSPAARGSAEAEQDQPPAPAQGAAAAAVKTAEHSKLKRKHVDLKSLWDRVGKRPISIESKVQSTSPSIQLQAQNESDIRDEVLSPESMQPSIEPPLLSPLIDDDEDDDDGDDEAVYDIDLLSHDPGKQIPITQYDVNEQDAVRRGYIALGPCQPREHDFPKRNIGDYKVPDVSECVAKNEQVDSQQASVDSTAQTGHAGAGDWQEEIYQMVKSLKDQYFAELSELYNKISVKLQHVDSMIPRQKPSDQYERMKGFKLMLERTLQFLQINKNNIQPALREKVPAYERQIIGVLNSQRRKPVQTQGQQQFQQSAGQALNSNILQQQQLSQGLPQHDSHTNQQGSRKR